MCACLCVGGCEVMGVVVVVVVVVGGGGYFNIPHT